MTGQIMMFEVPVNGEVKAKIEIRRADGRYGRPDGKIRFRRAITCSIQDENGIIVDGISLCRPPDKFDVKFGSKIALQEALRQCDTISAETKQEIVKHFFQYRARKRNAKKNAEKKELKEFLQKNGAPAIVVDENDIPF